MLTPDFGDHLLGALYAFGPELPRSLIHLIFLHFCKEDLGRLRLGVLNLPHGPVFFLPDLGNPILNLYFLPLLIEPGLARLMNRGEFYAGEDRALVDGAV